MLLNEKAIKNAQLKSKPYKLADGDGLYLLINPSGSKLWRFKYCFANKERLLVIGKYPEITLLEARDRRYAARKLLRKNIDPNSKKKAAKRATLFDANNSFIGVSQDWFKTNKRKWTAKHADRVWRRLELYAFPTLAHQPIAHIETPELVTILRKLEKRNKGETARRLSRSIRSIFRHGVHCGILKQNPAADLQGILVPHTVTHFAAVPVSELPELFAKLEHAKASPQSKIAVKLLLHVFVRPGELRYGKWAEIDWKQKLWTIPSERMKKRRPHVVPLSDAAIALLWQLHGITGYSEYLFPSQQRRRHAVMSENTINKVLKGMGYKDRQVGHGFRAIASTVLNESALFRSDVIEMQLAHVEENNSRKPYNRAEYLEERKQMMQWYSDYLENKMKPL